MAQARKPAKTSEGKEESDVIGTVMSLVIAFTLAMAFRGFVLEGFVIPTGSMGPTLMGEHVRLLSPVTAYEYPADSQVQRGMLATGDNRAMPIMDPMVSTQRAIDQREPAAIVAEARSGDRVAVLKPLYAFSRPQRWDVVVFKNPPDPVGISQNYIKRLVGLPNETVLLLDGDVFTGPVDAAVRSLRIERKPEFVQRALWQPVHDGDYQPVMPIQALEAAMRMPWPGSPWKPAANAEAWKLAPSREWTFTGAGGTALAWSPDAFPLDDWNAYNALRMAFGAARQFPQGMADPAWRQQECFPVSDLRLCATVECGAMQDFVSVMELTARNSVMELTIRGKGEAEIVRRHAETGDLLGTAKASFEPPSDGLISFECWHVDQQLWIFIGGERVARMPYDYATLDERLAASMFGRTVEQYVQRPAATPPTPPRLAWRFETSAPFTLRNVRVDRDLYYRPVLHDANNQFALNGDYVSGTGFACNYESPARLGPTDHLMLGDNSAASRDARLWGRAHPLTLRTFGDSQPGVVPTEMIVGKAFFVYWPSSSRGRVPVNMALVPDFGRMRFIR